MGQRWESMAPIPVSLNKLGGAGLHALLDFQHAWENMGLQFVLRKLLLEKRLNKPPSVNNECNGPFGQP